MEIVDPVPVELRVDELFQSLRTRRIDEKEVSSLLEKCRRLIEPKAVYTSAKVTGIGKNEVQLDTGHILNSAILVDTLEQGQMVTPYAVTIGPRLEEEASEEGKTSIIRAWILERAGDYALGKASGYVKTHIEKTSGGTISAFSPGAGTGKLFGIEQQEVLFKILDPSRHVGINLTPSFLMVPRKSISGIFAATRQEYVACQYCPREKCFGRRKPFSGEYFSLKCEKDVPL